MRTKNEIRLDILYFNNERKDVDRQIEREFRKPEPREELVLVWREESMELTDKIFELNKEISDVKKETENNQI